MAGAKKLTETPVSDEEIYGKATPRSYREAITAEQLEILRGAGQEPHDGDSAQEAAAEVYAPEAPGTPDPVTETADKKS